MQMYRDPGLEAVRSQLSAITHQQGLELRNAHRAANGNQSLNLKR